MVSKSTILTGKWLLFAGTAILGGYLMMPGGKTVFPDAGLAKGNREIPGKETDTVSRMNGVSLTAPPEEVSGFHFERLKNQTGADWVSVIPYAFVFPGQPEVHFDVPRQWWGERTDGVAGQIRFAREHGLKIMLKPHVWVVHSGWIGEYGFETEEDWTAWEASYSQYILHFARLADSLGVELFCLSTETERAVRERPLFWLGLIARVREIYRGPLTYASNWDNYQQIPFWSALDFIGIDAYFPLTSSPAPDLEALLEAWKPYVAGIDSFQKQTGKPVLFTEYGYLSVPQGAWKTWTLENRLEELTPDMQSQSLAYEALFRTFWSHDWFAGGFLWKWYLEDQAGGPQDRDYTPQGKPVLEVIRSYYR